MDKKKTYSKRYNDASLSAAAFERVPVPASAKPKPAAEPKYDPNKLVTKNVDLANMLASSAKEWDALGFGKLNENQKVRLLTYAMQVVLKNSDKLAPVLKKNVGDGKGLQERPPLKVLASGQAFVVLPKFGEIPNPLKKGQMVPVGSRQWFHILDQMRLLGTQRSIIRNRFLQPSAAKVEEALGAALSKSDPEFSLVESMLLWFPKQEDDKERLASATKLIMDRVRASDANAFRPSNWAEMEKDSTVQPKAPPAPLTVKLGGITIHNFTKNFTEIRRYATGFSQKDGQLESQLECRPPVGTSILPNEPSSEDVARRFGLLSFRYIDADAFKAYHEAAESVTMSDDAGLLTHEELDANNVRHKGIIVSGESGRAYKVFPLALHLNGNPQTHVHYPIDNALTLRTWLDAEGIKPRDKSPLLYVILNVEFPHVPRYAKYLMSVRHEGAITYRMISDAPMIYFREGLARTYVPADKRGDVAQCEDAFVDALMKAVRAAAALLKEPGESDELLEASRIEHLMYRLYRNGSAVPTCFDPDDVQAMEHLREADAKTPVQRFSLNELAHMPLHQRRALL